MTFLETEKLAADSLALRFKGFWEGGPQAGSYLLWLYLLWLYSLWLDLLGGWSVGGAAAPYYRYV